MLKSRVLLFWFLAVTYTSVYGNTNLPSPKLPSKSSEVFARKRSSENSAYFALTMSLFYNVKTPYYFYEYVDPSVSLQVNSDLYFFQKILQLESLDKTAEEIKAINKINHFLSTNYKTKYLPGIVYSDDNGHIPKPLYLEELTRLSFEAIADGNENALRALLDNFNLLYIKNINGYSLLSYSILQQRNDIARILLYRGANINEQDNYGATPLSIAARINNLYVVKLLLKNGANPNTTDNFKKTPYDYALINNNSKMIKLLEKYLLLHKKSVNTKHKT